MPVAFIILGFAILLPYNPNTMFSAKVFASLATAEVHAVPLLVRILPVVPGEVNPVPPFPADKVPEADDMFTGGRMLERVAILISGEWQRWPDYVEWITLRCNITQILSIQCPFFSVYWCVRQLCPIAFG